MKQYIKIYLCGDCIHYNWKKNECNFGVHIEEKPSGNFYLDCPLDLHEEDEILLSTKLNRKKRKWMRRKGLDCWECSECNTILESDDIVRRMLSLRSKYDG